MSEAALFTTDTKKMRLLFSMILCFGNPSDPGQLWENHKYTLSEDILFIERQRLNNKELQLNSDMLNLSLFYLNEILEQHKKNLANFPGIPQLPIGYDPNTTILLNFERNRFIREHMAYDKETLATFTQECVYKEQKEIYRKITNNKSNNYHGHLYFLDGPCG